MEVITYIEDRPEFKTSGLHLSEYRSLFTATERLKFDKATSNIDGDFSWLTGGFVNINDDANVIGFEGFTYRDLLRTVKASYDAAHSNSCFDLRCKEVTMGLVVLDMLGILDDSTRMPTILKGVPI